MPSRNCLMHLYNAYETAAMRVTHCLVATEGEPMAYHANVVLAAFEGVTFPLGYANGEALYLTTTNMLQEGGMEVESYCNFGFASPLGPGSEAIFKQALRDTKDRIA